MVGMELRLILRALSHIGKLRPRGREAKGLGQDPTAQEEPAT